jgi:hypothetical protein
MTERRYTFEYNGIIYGRGTKIIIKKGGKAVNVFFNCIFTDMSRIEIYDNDMMLYSMPIQMFNDSIIEVTNNIDNRYTQLHFFEKDWTLRDELNNVDGMLSAWIWYIVLMILWTIFKENVGLWILTTYVFVKYRNKKLINSGYKI